MQQRKAQSIAHFENVHRRPCSPKKIEAWDWGKKHQKDGNG